MRHYRVRNRGDDQGEAYWLLAESEEDARRLVAFNIEEAREAEDSGKFECEVDSEKQPPVGLIYRRCYGPLTIKKR